jgi:hypothetical protein
MDENVENLGLQWHRPTVVPEFKRGRVKVKLPERKPHSTKA